MKLVLTREQCQAYDARTISIGNLPGTVLMENAGRGAAEWLLCQLTDRASSILIVAGPGNNGGDGLVVARRLLVHERAVTVVLLCEPRELTADAKIMWDAFVGLDGTYLVLADESELPKFDVLLAKAGVVVDAIFGTGLSRSVVGMHAEVIARLNLAKARRVSLDLPSGLDANRGSVFAAAVRADATVTFGHLKPGFLTRIGVEHSGAVHVVDIGVPPQDRLLCEHVAELHEPSELAACFVRRSPSAHKGRSGRIGILAGHPGTTGAALLAARGALRMGGGLVTHLGLAETLQSIESRVLEAMTRRLDPHRLTGSLIEATHGMDALVVGPGMGLGGVQTELVDYIVEHSELPVVLDADGLTLISGNLRRFRQAKGPRLLLPHPGEMARLLQITVSEVERDPISAMALLTDLTHAVVVLKGAYTLVGAPHHVPVVVGSPCSVMATGGTGDVLAGVAGALLADHDPHVAARLAVHLHSRAGHLWAEEAMADRGMLASELADRIPAAIAELTQRNPRLTD